MTPRQPDDLGQRVRAARAYAGISREMLADAMGLKSATLGRIEAGVEPLAGDDRRAIIHSVATVTGIPEAAFTVDYAELVGEPSPETTLHQLERKLDETLAEMREMVAEVRAATHKPPQAER